MLGEPSNSPATWQTWGARQNDDDGVIIAILIREVNGHRPREFATGETEAQGGYVICPKSLNK